MVCAFKGLKDAHQLVVSPQGELLACEVYEIFPFSPVVFNQLPHAVDLCHEDANFPPVDIRSVFRYEDIGKAAGYGLDC